MPLVKDLKVDRDLCVDTFRRREFIIQKDFIRRSELGKEVSIRSASMKGEGLIRTLRDIAEDDVAITTHAIEAYENAEDWLCRKLNDIFQSVLHMGFRTNRLPFERQFYCETNDAFVENCNQLAWFPAAAMYLGDERIYIFRVASLQPESSKGWSPTREIDSRHAGAIGFTREYLGTFSSELSSYMQLLESKAMATPEVKDAFDRLSAILRPTQYQEEKLKERMAEYKDTPFGGWT